MGEGSTAAGEERDLIACLSPFGRPDPAVVLAALRSGALGVLDLGRDAPAAIAALEEVVREAPGPFGVRVGRACPLGPEALPDAVDTVVLEELGEPGEVARWAGPPGGSAARRVLVEVRAEGEARAAAAAGAHGLVARGSESGGLVGEETTLVLLSALAGKTGLPVWAAGGIGVHTAAAAVAGGAVGVVLDSQLALMAESGLPEGVRRAVAAMDGSETAVVGGHRVYVRPGLPGSSLAARGAAPAEVAALLGAEDLATTLLPAGQDAALARPFAERWPAVGAVVAGLRREIASHLALARELDPLAPGAGVAREHGLRYPVAQGPMTRVSDRAGFAAEVAEAGGLPFLALALMPAGEVRPLLEETASRLEGRAWGVGVLGFVPPEVRQAQLEVIHDVRPPVALIAGGRPSQARPLEEAGIATYLHVPSPGLLERFVKEGARRFVFEGRECGGHVGPRSSFSLWEAQIQVLLEAGVADEVSVLFAGGVHDARTAAMVAAAGAPLAAAGGRLGVLMGTAYLFTEEAVAAGAIVPGFQQQALACRGTVLLETSPGHATRCADTPYVAAFRAERSRLEQGGASTEELWSTLEVLNLGRLRVASKGLIHADHGLEPVDPDRQVAEGMYMLGQVAALHRETTTVAALHQEVSAGASCLLAGLEEQEASLAAWARPVEPPAAEVAIVGMACVFPGAPDTDTFWANVVGAVDSVTEVPAERWDPARYYDPGSYTTGAGRRTPSKWGGFLPDVPFDALAYGIPPRALASIEPVQLLSLEVAARAMADAGYGPGSRRELDRERVSVIFGAEAGTDLAGAYGFRALAGQYLGGVPGDLDQILPELTEDSFPGLLTNVIAGRIANRLDFGGVNFTVDAACASSLAAVDAAVKELAGGTSDVVLCGGADLHNGINDYLLFAAVHALSPSGRCASFDASADGIALGEGVACVVLKRLEDARRDGDRVYAVLQGIAGSSDGRSLGLTAPRPEGQRRALERAYARSRVDPAGVGLVEAHGTGTVVGDRTELAVLTQVFADAGAAAGSCTLGSVKSQIGHTKCAAGLASLIKVARSLHHGVLPPTIHVEEPNPGYDPEAGPFALRREAGPWPEEERRAGVSAFGFGGTNFHAVLRAAGPEETRPPAFGLEEWPAELFLFRSADGAGALAALDALGGTLGALPTGRARAAVPRRLLRDLAAGVWAAGEGPVRVALVATDLEDLEAKVARAREGLAGDGTGDGTGGGAGDGAVAKADNSAGNSAGEPAGNPAGNSVGEPVGDRGAGGVHVVAGDVPPPPTVAFMFPGQGSQRPGMLRELFTTFPDLHRHLRRGARWVDRLFPPAAFDAAGKRAQAAALTDTRVAQPVMGLADLAVADLLKTVGVQPDLVGGHSYGELVALAVAGALPEEDLLALSEARAEAILGAAGEDPGAMVAVSAAAADVARALGPDADVVLGNDNGPGQVVLSGPTEAVEKAAARLAEGGLATKRLPVACAFHSPVVAGAQGALAGELARLAVSPPSVPAWSNVTAEPYPDDPAAVRDLLARQVANPVRFREQVLAMHGAGARLFVEVGPGRVLTGLVRRILEDQGLAHRAVSVSGGRGDLHAFLSALAQMAAAGVPVDAGPLFTGRSLPQRPGEPPAALPGWLVNGASVRTQDGSVVPGALPPADLVTPVPLASTPGTGAAGEVGAGSGGVAGPEQAVVEYLRTLRETVAAGRDVLLGLLGAPAPASAPLAGPDGPPGTLAYPAAGAAVAVASPAAEVVAQPAGGAVTGVGATATVGRVALDPATVRAAVLEVVSTRTGYPQDMLDPTLDLEADLSIDSIKRLEIVGELAERVGLGVGEEGPDETLVEELVAVKTLDGMVAWLVEKLVPPAGVPGGDDVESGTSPGDEAVAGTSALGDGGAAPPMPVPERAQRYVPRLVPVGPPASGPGTLAGARVAVTDDGGGVAAALAPLLEGIGAHVQVVGAGEPLGRADVLVHLAALAPSAAPGALELFERSREALLAGTGTILAATATGGTLGMTAAGAAPAGAVPAGRGKGLGGAAFLRHAGMRGVIKTVARERSTCRARLVDLEEGLAPAEAAAAILAELGDPGGPVEVGRTRSARVTVVVEPAPLAPVSPEPVPGAAPLGPGDVLLVTGGARGVTSRVAGALAHRWGCRLVLVGRTPLPLEEEDPATAAAGDAVALRRVLAGKGFGPPAAIEARVRQLLAAREVRATLDSLAGRGVAVDYRTADVARPEAVRQLVEGVYADYGRLDGVMHGAGVLEDARIEDKETASFLRVFDTKVTGALGAEGALRDGLRMVVFFSSVAGIFGNRGQVDYAAANDALTGVARHLAGRLPGRVVAVDWGPWAGGGMVSTLLAAEFERRGVGLLDPEDAVACLVAELESGAGDPEVVIMRAEPERFA